jgi:hypothetical protein
MNLQKWAEYGWLRSHKSSKKEISDLLRIIERDLLDAAGDISADWRFGIAYNAALKLCTILLYAEGYRPEKNLQHYRTIQALPRARAARHLHPAPQRARVVLRGHLREHRPRAVAGIRGAGSRG